MMTTLKDIAKKTGVSITTISRILSNDSSLNVAPETKTSVLACAKELNYIKKIKPTLESKMKIALIHWYSSKEEMNDPYYLHIRLGVESHARKIGVPIISHYFTHANDILPHASGAIAIGKFDEIEIKKLHQTYDFIVFVDSSPTPKKDDSVLIDFMSAYEEAYHHLLSLGITEIGYIGGREYTKTMNLPIIDPRESFMIQKQTPLKHIHIGSFNSTSGYEIMKQIIEHQQLAQAYLVGNDHMAIGCLSALHEKGINVPEDVSLIGFNGIEESAFTIPPLTTIKVYQSDLGKSAINALIERIKGRTIPEKIMLPTELIIRQTTKEKKS